MAKCVVLIFELKYIFFFLTKNLVLSKKYTTFDKTLHVFDCD